jgi:hypothetical protein
MGNKASAPPPPPPLSNYDQVILPGLTEIESRVDAAKVCADMSGEIIPSHYIIIKPALYNKKAILYVFDTSHNLIHGEMFDKGKFDEKSFIRKYGFANGEKLIPFKYISTCKISDEDLVERDNTNTHHTTQPELGIMCDPTPGPTWEDILYNPKKYDRKVLVYRRKAFGSGLDIQRFSSANNFDDLGS